MAARWIPAAGWKASLAVYVAFAAAVFWIHGSQPLLGPDHLSYFLLADSLRATCPPGEYWREASSVNNFGVLLAYLYGFTGEHVLSMKAVLAVFTVLYLLAAERFFGLFTRNRWHAVLFALLSAFAVSFGIASWGVTDSTALLPRTLVAPIIVFCAWWWIRFDGRPAKYLAFPILILGSLLHLSTFYMAAVLAIVELIDLQFFRRGRIDRNFAAFVAGIAASGALLFGLETAGLSTRVIGVQIPEMLRMVGFKLDNIEPQGPRGCAALPRPAVPAPPPKAVPVPAPAPATPAGPSGETPPAPAANPPSKAPAVASSAKPAAKAPAATASTASTPGAPAAPVRAPPQPVATPDNPHPLSAKEAWAIELRLRPWRNMPLPLVNLANALSSSALILLLALGGMVLAWRRGFTRADRMMLAMFVAVPVFALGPQTLLWWLRSFTSIYPMNIEEVRALGLVLIPSLYFVLRLFERTVAAGGPLVAWKAGAIVAAVLFLPLFMKNLPRWAREELLSAMVATHVVDAANESRVTNARVALGLGAAAAPLYYSTRGVRSWIERHVAPGSRILTDRDDLILLRGQTLLGPRQQEATAYYATPELTDLFLKTAEAMAARDTEKVVVLARAMRADYAVVAWRAPGAAFADEHFSVLAVHADGAPA